jgi:hypothetical protein
MSLLDGTGPQLVAPGATEPSQPATVPARTAILVAVHRLLLAVLVAAAFSAWALSASAQAAEGPLVGFHRTAIDSAATLSSASTTAQRHRFVILQPWRQEHCADSRMPTRTSTC